MNWKTDLQLRDIGGAQRLEATCRLCGYTHYIDIQTLLRQPELQFVYIDELERMSVCRARGCGGQMRLALVFAGETEGFLGGLA
ncbi:MAG TPA: hypothetical protein ENJ57_08710 [Rhizobiales bacterium]|nr:hypothetical protein [Hyphomicrobiales bacterium]